MIRPVIASALILLSLSACSKSEAPSEVEAPAASESAQAQIDNSLSTAPTTSPVTPAIMIRPPATEYSNVRHILISWSEKAPTYQGRGGQDPRGSGRTREDANRLTNRLVENIKNGTDFAVLMHDYSEDKGSAKNGRTYAATPTASLVAPFRDLALRLEVNELGVVETDFGYHIIQRVE